MIGVYALALTLAMQSPAPNRVDEILDRADDAVVTWIDEWFKHGEWSRALHGSRYRAFQFPSDYDAVTDYGFLLENMEEPAAALEVYRDFHRNNPQDKDGWLAEITFHFVRKQYAEVIKLAEPRLALRPHPNHYRMLGRAFEMSDKLADALRIFELLLKDYPGDTTAKMNSQRIREKIKKETP